MSNIANKCHPSPSKSKFKTSNPHENKRICTHAYIDLKRKF